MNEKKETAFGSSPQHLRATQHVNRNLAQFLDWEKKCKVIQPLDEMDKILATLDTRMAAIESWLDDHDAFFQQIASVSKPPVSDEVNRSIE